MPTTPRTVVLTADVVLFSLSMTEEVHVLLIQRGTAPHRGRWALPGGTLNPTETFAAAAGRELREETGLPAPHLELINIYDNPDRDPRGRFVSVAFVGLIEDRPTPTAGDDAALACWVRLGAVLTSPARLAFDHHTILTDAARMQGWLP